MKRQHLFLCPLVFCACDNDTPPQEITYDELCAFKVEEFFKTNSLVLVHEKDNKDNFDNIKTLLKEKLIERLKQEYSTIDALRGTDVEDHLHNFYNFLSYKCPQTIFNENHIQRRAAEFTYFQAVFNSVSAAFKDLHKEKRFIIAFISWEYCDGDVIKFENNLSEKIKTLDIDNETSNLDIEKKMDKLLHPKTAAPSS